MTPFKGLDRVEVGIVAFCLLIVVALLSVLGYALYLGITEPSHKGEHCVQMNYVHHAKMSARWECTAYVKLRSK